MKFALGLRIACFGSLVLLAAPAGAAPQSPATPFACQTVAPPAFQSSWLALGSPAQSGQVVITELQKDPTIVSDAHGEWIEIWNSLSWRCNLDGWTLSDDAGNSHTLSSGGTTALIMRPGERFVLGIDGNMMTNGMVPVNYVYSGFTLSNSAADQIVLSKPDGTLVDRVEFDNVNYPHTPGRSIQLNENFRSVYYNDDPGEWCESQSHWELGSPDTGTPGQPNDPCQ
ncbi:MAG: lamin tail domain-containing protein [Planctomycetes bacterium]|nr:lamin tail domain-containing protein [Planctomycetota bacterium]